MDLTSAEEAIIELLRSMGAEPLHVAFTSAGNGVAFTLVTADTGHVAGWGATSEEALSNVFGVPEPGPEPASRSPFRVVAGTDTRP